MAASSRGRLQGGKKVKKTLRKVGSLKGFANDDEFQRVPRTDGSRGWNRGLERKWLTIHGVE